MTRKRALLMIAVFGLTIFGGGIANASKGTRPKSPFENRTLAQLPQPATILNGTFASAFETFFSDQFLMRDKLIEWQMRLEMFRKTSVKDMYITRDNWMLPTQDNDISEPTLKQQAGRLADFRDELASKGRKMYHVLTPYRGSVLSFLYPSYASGLKGVSDNLRYYREGLDRRGVAYTDLDTRFRETFDKEKLMSFYFKTDHHWNGDAALEGMKMVYADMHKVFPELKFDFRAEAYDRTLITGKPFSGSHSSNFFDMIHVDETIPYYWNRTPQGYQVFIYENGGFAAKPEEALFQSARSWKTMSYEGVYTMGLPCYRVVNPHAQTDKKILVYRDSYESPTTVFLSDIFREVTVVDPRSTAQVGLHSKQLAFDLDVDYVMPMFVSQTFNTMVGLMLD